MHEFTAKDAVAGILIAVIRADGREVRSEVEAAGDRLLTFLEAGRITRTDLFTRLEWMVPLLEREGADSFLARCVPHVPETARGRLLRAAFDVALADRSLTPEETALVDRLASALLVREPVRR